MSPQTQLTRREFLKYACMAPLAALLRACGPSFTPENNIPITPSVTSSKEPIDVIVPEMVQVEAGSFEMGSADGYPNEQPVHRILITKPFLICKYEVTYDEYDRFYQDMAHMEFNDGGFGRGSVPILQVDWYDAVAYCNWLSEKHELIPCYSGAGKNTMCDFLVNGYRLPTEAEWEYAAGGGQQSHGYTYAGSNDPDEVGWYEETSNGLPHPVGEKVPNELGLYDMSGNVFEWCWDWYDEDYYASSSAIDPQGPPVPMSLKPWELTRVRRSGCWREKMESIRTTTRSFDTASYPGENGFRLVRTA